MANDFKDNDSARLKDMKEKIEAIDRLSLELKDLGKGLPVIEKNVLAIQSFTHALKFGISDLADVTEN